MGQGWIAQREFQSDNGMISSFLHGEADQDFAERIKRRQHWPATGAIEYGVGDHVLVHLYRPGERKIFFRGAQRDLILLNSQSSFEVELGGTNAQFLLINRTDRTKRSC